MTHLTRHVSFKEDSYGRSPAQSTTSFYSIDPEAQKKKWRPRCNRCCAWTSAAIGIAVVIVLIGLIIFYSFLVANMPRFYLNGIEVDRMKVATDKNGDSTLTAKTIARFNVSNSNGRISFSYSKFTGEVTLDGVSLGRTELPSFHQGTHNTTKMEVWSTVEALAIETADGDDLVSNSMRHLLTVDLSLLGHIEYRVRQTKVSSCPFKVTCQQAPQPVLDSGVGFECNVRMSPLRLHGS